MTKKKPITLESSLKLSEGLCTELFETHITPGLSDLFKWLGYHNMDVIGAKGSHLLTRNAGKILDLTSACGVLNLGHNHPELIAAEEFCHQNFVPDSIKFGVHPLHGVLAHNLSLCLGDDLTSFYYTTSGSEALEAAIKVCTRYQGEQRPYFIRFTGGFHGKTHGALPFSESEDVSSHFRWGYPEDYILTCNLNDSQKLNELFESKGDQIAGVVLELIQGQTLQCAQSEFITLLRALAHKHSSLLIIDEIKAGLGRTGNLFSFQEFSSLRPDIVLLSKGLAGGKRALGVMATREEIWKRSFSGAKQATILSTTFNGFGESCALAIKTLEILERDEFKRALADTATYFKAELLRLQAKYPKKIKSIPGKGLMLGVELTKIDSPLKALDLPFKDIQIARTASLVRELLVEHKVLTHFISTSTNILQILPPLTIERADIDHFINALDKCLAQSGLELISKFALGRIL